MGTPLLDHIVACGNRAPLRAPYDTSKNTENKIRCADGLTLSVIAGDGTYCTPRPSQFSILADVPQDYSGPYTAVEVGYPSERPEPWDDWKKHAEDAEDPTETVYPYVPVEMVRALVAAHGGETR